MCASTSVVLSVLLIPLAAPGAQRTGFGENWVRTHPFTLMGLNIQSANLDVPEYTAASFTSLLAWEEPATQARIASQGNLPWHAHIRPAHQGPDAHLQGLVNGAAVYPGAYGWLLHDEPSHSHMAGIGDAAAWIQERYPDTLVYCNAFPSYASPELLWGDGTNPGYSFGAYIEDFITLIGPDVMMYDHYPFEADGDTKDSYFSDLMTVRARAQAHGIPYWSFMQSWANVNARLPSESDLRMQVFSTLAAGYTGLAYFTYDKWDDGGLLDAGGAPTPLYPIAAEINREVLHLGGALRSLTSTDVRFLPGKQTWIIWEIDNTPPDGLSNWSAGAGGDPHMVEAWVDTSNPADWGAHSNGLLGFFTDDDGEPWFMLVNLNHAANTTAANATLPLVVQFDGSVESLVEIDRDTGLEIQVPLSHHRLAIRMLGGSGRLYRYGAGNVDDGGGGDSNSPGDSNAPGDSGDGGREIGDALSGDHEAGPAGDHDRVVGRRKQIDAGGCFAAEEANALPTCAIVSLALLVRRRKHRGTTSIHARD